MRFYFTSAALCVLATAGLGCSPDLTKYPPLQGCDRDAGVCNGGPSGGGVGSAGTGSGGAGGATSGTTTGAGGVGVGELQGDVEPITNQTFTGTSGTPVTGSVSIVFQPA